MRKGDARVANCELASQMTALTPGQEIVAPYRGHDGTLQRALLDDIAAAIDKRCTVLEENARSAGAAERIAHERAIAAEKLAAERLEGLLAAAQFATILAKQLRLENGENR